MTEFRTKATHAYDPDYLPGLLDAYLADVQEITGKELTPELMEAWHYALYCYSERPENGLGMALGFGLALCSEKAQCYDVLEAYLWLSNDGRPL
ncbi:MAG TPA: hypothetical protein VIZ86_16670 [Pseudomonas sp.]